MKILDTLSVYSKSFSLYTIFLYYLNDLKQKIPNSFDILRIMFWYNDYYLKNSKLAKLLNEEFEEHLNLYDEKLIEKLHDFRLVYPKRCKKNTPYKNCYDFLDKFIDELNEDSFLLEILYLLDSDIANNRIYENVRIFQLSLLSLSQIKEHLKSIIPDVIVRKLNSKCNQCNAGYFRENGIMEFFEGTLYVNKDFNYLNSILIDNEDNDCKYTLPLLMLFFFELFNYVKFRLDNSESKKPSYFYNPYDNYNLYFHYIDEEGKRLFEYYISNEIEIIEYLKFSFLPNKELMNVKLWTSNDLSELRQIIKKKIEINNFKTKKNFYNFPYTKQNKMPILADGTEDEFNSPNYQDDLYDTDDNYPKYFSQYKENTKIYCI